MPSKDAGTSTLMEMPPPPSVGRPDSALPAFCIALRSQAPYVKAARRAARAWVLRWCAMPEDQADVLVLVLSELCTNAVVHGRYDSYELRGWMSAQDEVCLEVNDHSPSPIPVPRHAGSECENGRGLLLVDVLIEQMGGAWGFSEDGARAWCRVPLKPPGWRSGRTLLR